VSQWSSMRCNRHEDEECTCHTQEASRRGSVDAAQRQAAVPALRHLCNGQPLDGAYCVPHVIVMVGLPARGKTYMAQKLTRYLQWIGVNTKVFNLGDYRRKATDSYRGNHLFFSADNSEAMKLREQCCQTALRDVAAFLRDGGKVAVFDATNTTRVRRAAIHRQVHDMRCKLFYIESICDDEELIAKTIRQVKVSGRDYVGVSEEAATADFFARIEHYKRQYQTIDDDLEKHLSFMKIFNTGTKIVIHRNETHLMTRIAYYFMNCHIVPRTIYLTRHGESKFNVLEKLGGDSELSNSGVTYAKAFAKYINLQNISNLQVWTSTLKRTRETAKHINAPKAVWKQLNEIHAGVCEELTYKQIAERYPEDFKARDEDKLRYRYPRGESYQDLIVRLEPVIMQLERHTNVLVVAHQAVLRCIVGYFAGVPLEDIPYIKVPLHQVIRLVTSPKGCSIEQVPLDVEAVTTYRGKPAVPGTFEEPETSSRCFDENK